MVYGHYKYVYSYSAGIEFSRQNLTSTARRLRLRPNIKTTLGQYPVLAGLRLLLLLLETLLRILVKQSAALL